MDAFIVALLMLWGVMLLLIGLRWPEIVLSANFSVLIFWPLVKTFVPVSAMLLAACLTVLAVMCGVLRGYGISFVKPQIVAFVLAGIVLLGVRFSHNQAYGIDKALIFVVLCVPTLVSIPLLINTDRALTRVLDVIAATLVSYTIVASLMYLAGTGTFEGSRYGGFSDVIIGGRIAGIAVLFCLFWYIPAGGYRMLIGYAALIMAMGLALLSGTRTVLIGLFCTIVILVMIPKCTRERRGLGKWGKPMILAILILAVPFFLETGKMGDDYTARYGSYTGLLGISEETDNIVRLMHYKTSWDGFLSAPLFGIGTGGYKSLFVLPNNVDPQHPVYPHNIFLEFLCEQGLVGLSVFLLLLFYVVQSAKRTLNEISTNSLYSNTAIVILSFFIFSLIGTLTALDIARQYLFWWSIGLVLACAKIVQGSVHQAAPNTKGCNGQRNNTSLQ